MSLSFGGLILALAPKVSLVVFSDRDCAMTTFGDECRALLDYLWLNVWSTCCYSSDEGAFVMSADSHDLVSDFEVGVVVVLVWAVGASFSLAAPSGTGEDTYIVSSPLGV